MKIPLISGIEVIKRLKKSGFIATRQKGSHVRIEKRHIKQNNKRCRLTLEEFEKLK